MNMCPYLSIWTAAKHPLTSSLSYSPLCKLEGPSGGSDASNSAADKTGGFSATGFVARLELRH
jgi:hypothetical protein